jgi:very-long-chain enoyl-CoA reductase
MDCMLVFFWQGSTSRNIPTGPLFSLVSCPNYTAEVLSWIGFSVLTGLLMCACHLVRPRLCELQLLMFGVDVVVSAWVFTAVGLAQMSQWALSKHRAYVK